MLMAIGCCLSLTREAGSHCDTLGGPVVQDARIAIEKGDVMPVLKWVRKDAELEIRRAFDKALLDRKKSPEAADKAFYEILVRVHRAGEGEPFAGLKPAGAIEPAVARADESIKKGSVDELAAAIAGSVSHGIKERFEKVMKTGAHKDETVEAGRNYVSAYVDFVHYVEQISETAEMRHGHVSHPK